VGPNAQRAHNAFLANRLIGLPTETVYGLAAPFDNKFLVERIFELKERPFFDPLILHVSDVEMAKSLASAWFPSAELLAKAFWPGPLTLVLPKASHVLDVITSGLPTVGLRCPSHPIAQEIIMGLGKALAAPSANKFKKTSPTEACHVSSEFAPENVEVIDGGPCRVGIESTIVKIESGRAFLLRPGLITAAEINKVLAPLAMVLETVKTTTIEAPGQIEHHYMPPIPLVFAKAGHSLESAVAASGVKCQKPLALDLSKSPELAARELYGKMRKLCEEGADLLVHLDSGSAEEAWAAVVDRLWRASTYKV
jgi:L-threonylcarbamoyladenylate synthase